MSSGSSYQANDPPVHSEDGNAGLRDVIRQIMAEERETMIQSTESSGSQPTNQPG